MATETPKPLYDAAVTRLLLLLGLVATASGSLAQGNQYPATKTVSGVKFIHLGAGIYGSGPAGGPQKGGVAPFVMLQERANRMCSVRLSTPHVDYWGQSRSMDGTLQVGVSDGRGPVKRMVFRMAPNGTCEKVVDEVGGSGTWTAGPNGMLTYTPQGVTPPRPTSSPATPAPAPSAPPVRVSPAPAAPPASLPPVVPAAQLDMPKQVAAAPARTDRDRQIIALINDTAKPKESFIALVQRF
ncbi:hypothetical protein [Deinococcus sp. NW-56]|uniref:hypothetical protein n=1 Tax=Deinococcus sp. NW-56 TaxID=2080419 RepID=UPI000CF36FB4|nr:hypothetical protein [Deinococcus sp. NW-56]